MKKPLMGLAGAVSVLALLLSGCAGNSDTEAGSASQTFSPGDGDGADDSADKPESTFVDGVLTTPDAKFEITRHKVIKAGQKGNEYGDKPVLALWYKTTNLSGDDIDPLAFIYHFEAYQDNDPNAVNKLDVGGLPDDAFLDSQMETIKKGGTVKNAIAYELDDLKTPVELVALAGFDDEVGRATYELN